MELLTQGIQEILCWTALLSGLMMGLACRIWR